MQPQASYLGSLCLSLLSSKKWDENRLSPKVIVRQKNKRERTLVFERSCNCKLLVLIRNEKRGHVALHVTLALRCSFATALRWVAYGKKVAQI